MKKSTHSAIKFFCIFVILLLFSDLMSAQYTPLPYFNGFENPSDTVGFVFKTRKDRTPWVVGNAQHCLGFKSLYTSTDDGVTANYASYVGGYVSIAYVPITLPQGTYALAFDYMMGGDGTNQSMKVAWAPSSVSLSAASMGSSFPNNITLYQFTDAGGNNEFFSAAWSHVSGQITVPAGGGTFNLCFAFRCNSSTIVNPGACVDNIQIDTVHASTDCVATPTGITVTKDAQAGVIVCWNGHASSYEVVAAPASDPTDYSFAVHDGVTTTCDTFQYSEFTEGQYFFYVRPICGNDTGMYAETSGHLIYDVSAHCIDFITFNAPGTQCTYGTYTNPYQNNGYIDNGPSQMSSRHTVHTDLSETDPRTNGALHTVPVGEMMSVRLGNWNNGSEAESVTYTYNVPAGSNLILMMKYAVVFEEPGHSEPPEFRLEIMNSNNQLLDSVCTKANFLCDGTLAQGWHSCQAIGSSSFLSTIFYNDWTTLGVNLTPYAGQTVKIRLTSYDCNASGHFGYAYFTLDCSQAELDGTSCGSGGTAEIKAPDGFNYRWINNRTGQEVTTSRSLSVAVADTCSYTCICSFKEHPSCNFSMTAYALPRLPEATFTYTFTYSDCQTHITFNNNSYVYSMQNGQKVIIPNKRIANQTWTVRSKHIDRPYNNRTSAAENLHAIDVPKEGDTLTITLTSFFSGCDDDTTVVIPVPALRENRAVTNRYVCQGQPVIFNEETYIFVTADSIEVVDAKGQKRYITGQKSIQVIDTLKSWCGCDSILELNLRGLVTDTIMVDTTLYGGECYRLNVRDAAGITVLDTCLNESGTYNIPVGSSLGTCDSLLYIVNLKFTLHQFFMVTVSSSNDGFGYVEGGGAYMEGSIATINAVAYPGYKFQAWNDGNTENPRSFEVTSNMNFVATFVPDKKCLNFTAESGSATICLNQYGNTYSSVVLKYSTDNCATWQNYTIGQNIQLSSGGKVFFSAAGVNGNFSTEYGYYYFSIAGNVSADGNIMSLLDADMNQMSVPDYSFYHLFQECATMTQAPNLPATTLGNHCYEGMFAGCASITNAPVLNAKTMAVRCYANMFERCASLTKVTSLPAAMLAEGCYSLMFANCISLLKAPELPSTLLAENCYNSMFRGCASLTNVPQLPASALRNGCYSQMFMGCTTLRVNFVPSGTEWSIPSYAMAPESDWANDMFSNTGGQLTGAPEIGVTYYISSDTIVAVENVQDNMAITLWPNPIHVGQTAYLSIDEEDVSVEIYTISGLLVGRIENASGAVAIEGLNTAGVYVVKVTDRKGVTTVGRLLVE